MKYSILTIVFHHDWSHTLYHDWPLNNEWYKGLDDAAWDYSQPGYWNLYSYQNPWPAVLNSQINSGYFNASYYNHNVGNYRNYHINNFSGYQDYYPVHQDKSYNQSYYDHFPSQFSFDLNLPDLGNNSYSFSY